MAGADVLAAPTAPKAIRPGWSGPAPRAILIVKPSALGDVVQALPVLGSLKAHWPETPVDWVINDSFADLLRGHPGIRRLFLYPRRRWKSPARWGEILPWARRLHDQRYDLVLDLQGLARSALMTLATGSEVRLGPKSAREGARFAYSSRVEDHHLSAAERYLSFLDYLGVPRLPYAFGLTASSPLPPALTALAARSEDGSPSLAADQGVGRSEMAGIDHFATVAAPARPYIVIHPYSRWRTKLWPFRYYEELLTHLPAELDVVVVGQGPWFPIDGPRVHDLRGQQSLGGLVSVLQHARAVLSTDSGPAHIAAALGRPTLVLFGATDWRKTQPVGEKVVVLNHAIFCSPCLKRSCRREIPMECMSELTPRQVGGQLTSIALTSSP